MLDILELNSKSQEDLVAIAKELKVRKPDSLSKENLIYAILDEQAIQSKESPAKQRQQRKKGARKSETADNAAAIKMIRTFFLFSYKSLNKYFELKVSFCFSSIVEYLCLKRRQK